MKIEQAFILYIIFVVGLVIVVDFFDRATSKENFEMKKYSGKIRGHPIEKFETAPYTYIPEESIFEAASQSLHNLSNVLARTSDSYDTLQQTLERQEQGLPPQSWPIDSRTLLKQFSKIENPTKQDTGPYQFYEPSIKDKRRVFDYDVKYQLHAPEDEERYLDTIQKKYAQTNSKQVLPFDPMSVSFGQI